MYHTPTPTRLDLTQKLKVLFRQLLTRQVAEKAEIQQCTIYNIPGKSWRGANNFPMCAASVLSAHTALDVLLSQLSTGCHMLDGRYCYVKQTRVGFLIFPMPVYSLCVFGTHYILILSAEWILHRPHRDFGAPDRIAQYLGGSKRRGPRELLLAGGFRLLFRLRMPRGSAQNYCVGSCCCER